MAKEVNAVDTQQDRRRYYSLSQKRAVTFSRDERGDGW
jgi:hypothetical protein